MDLTIDEKMQLVQKMRTREDAPQREREGRLSFPAVRVVLSICLFGCYLYLQYGHASISGIGAADVSAYISADGFRPGHSGDK